MPTSLADQFISDTYKGLLHIGDSQFDVDGFLPLIYDGLGNPSSVRVGKEGDGVNITGNTNILGDAKVANNANVNGTLVAGNIEYPLSDYYTTLFDIIYPMYTVLFTYNNVNPGIKFKGTHWIPIAQGRFIASVGVGRDDTNTTKEIFIDENSGEYAHKLTVDELAKHYHIMPGDDMLYWAKDKANWEGISEQAWPYDAQSTATGSAQMWRTSEQGNNTPHNNLPPGFGLYTWCRVPLDFIPTTHPPITTTLPPCVPISYNTITPSVMNSNITYFEGGKGFEAGLYTITYTGGALKFNSKNATWSVWNYFINYNSGRAEVRAPAAGSPYTYSSIEAAQTALANSYVAIQHSGGPIGIYLSDNPYTDNVGPGASYKLDKICVNNLPTTAPPAIAKSEICVVSLQQSQFLGDCYDIHGTASITRSGYAFKLVTTLGNYQFNGTTSVATNTRLATNTNHNSIDLIQLQWGPINSAGGITPTKVWNIGVNLGTGANTYGNTNNNFNKISYTSSDESKFTILKNVWFGQVMNVNSSYAHIEYTLTIELPPAQ